MCKALDLSKYIVSKCIKDGHPISNLQLQKILYYIQREFLGRDEIAFFDDIEAWQFGPVVPNVYYYFSGFGAMPISIPSADYPSLLDDMDMGTVDRIVEEKRNLKPWAMVSETHRSGGAWAQTYKDGEGLRKVIPVDLIKEEL